MLTPRSARDIGTPRSTVMGSPGSSWEPPSLAHLERGETRELENHRDISYRAIHSVLASKLWESLADAKLEPGRGPAFVADALA